MTELQRVVVAKQCDIEHFKKGHPEWIVECGPVARFSDHFLLSQARAAVEMSGGGRVVEVKYESDLEEYVATYFQTKKAEKRKTWNISESRLQREHVRVQIRGIAESQKALSKLWRHMSGTSEYQRWVRASLRNNRLRLRGCQLALAYLQRKAYLEVEHSGALQRFPRLRRILVKETVYAMTSPMGRSPWKIDASHESISLWIEQGTSVPFREVPA